MKRAVHFTFYSVVLLAWLVVAGLAAEAFERARSYVSEHYYQRFLDEQLHKMYRMVPASEAQLPPPPPADAAPRAVPSGNTSAPGLSACGDVAALESARDAFAAKGEENRNIIGTVRGELHAVLTPDLAVTELWGDPMFQRGFLAAIGKGEKGGREGSFFPPLTNSFQQLKAGESTGSLRYLIDDRYAVEGSAKRVEGHYPNPDRIEVLVRQLSPPLVSPSVPLDDKFATDIAGVRYKRNWHHPGEIASYNNYGFRDDDIVVPKPVGCFRIVCIGGSTTEEGNSNDMSYPNIVERKLQAEFGKDRVDVVNCGLISITSYNELRRMDDFLELQPDLIVYYNGVNDACHEHLGIWRNMVDGWPKKMLASRLLTRLFNRRLLPADDVILDYMRRTTFRNLRAMAWRARECGADFAVCSFAYPRLNRLGFRDGVFLDTNLRVAFHGEYINYATYTQIMDLHNRLVRETCEMEGLHYIPVSESFDAGMNSFFDLCHTTPAGIETKSSIIADGLRPIVQKALDAKK